MEIGLGASVPGVHFPSETTSDEFANDLLNYIFSGYDELLQ